jgi:trimethylamine--corrinoid protein Co-methyltransferase
MHSNYTIQRTPNLRLLSDQQLETLHFAALEILRRTGIEVYDQEARELLRKAGSKIDGTRVRLPPHLVEWAIRAAPSRITLCDREGTPAMYLEGTRSYYGTGSDTPNVIDPYTGQRRQTVDKDIANAIKICDYLPNINFVMCMGIASNVTAAISDVHHFEIMVNHTRKPIVFTAWDVENLHDIVQMAEMVAGGPEALRFNPFIVAYLEPVSPLQLALEPTQKLLYMAGKGLPCIWVPGQAGGATSPVTLAGALAQGNAEALSGLVLAQLKREGAPVVTGGGSILMHMGTAVAAYESPEFMLSVMACAEMAHYYNLPVCSYAACSDAKVFDQQATIATGLWTLVSALSGGNLVHDVGYLESGLTASYEQLVVADEIIGMVKRITGGIEISEEKLALDVIDRVGPGGQFLSEAHTCRHFRENWFPKLLDWGNYASWVQKGEKTLGQRANKKVRTILETHVPDPLPEDIRQKLETIIERAETRVRQGS